MKTTYRIKGYIAHSEIDNFENGCIGPAKTECGDWYSVKADSIPALLKTLGEYFCSTSPEDFLLDSCDENGRIDLQVYQENPFEIGEVNPVIEAHWKEGLRDLWLTCYSFYVEKVIAGFSLVDEVQE